MKSSHRWTSAGTYQIKAMATDSKGHHRPGLCRSISPLRQPPATDALHAIRLGFRKAKDLLQLYRISKRPRWRQSEVHLRLGGWNADSDLACELRNGIELVSQMRTAAGTYQIRAMATDSRGHRPHGLRRETLPSPPAALTAEPRSSRGPALQDGIGPIEADGMRLRPAALAACSQAEREGAWC